MKKLNPFFWVNYILGRLLKQYRLVGEIDRKGIIAWKAQVRVNGIQWANVITDDWQNGKNPYLSSRSSVSYHDKQRAIDLLNEWKQKVSYVKPDDIIEYIS